MSKIVLCVSRFCLLAHRKSSVPACIPPLRLSLLEDNDTETETADLFAEDVKTKAAHDTPLLAHHQESNQHLNDTNDGFANLNEPESSDRLNLSLKNSNSSRKSSSRLSATMLSTNAKKYAIEGPISSHSISVKELNGDTVETNTSSESTRETQSPYVLYGFHF